MPELSRFYGIIIYMFVKDHNPPNFHAKYGEDKAIISIKSGELIEGNLPPRALRLIKEWVDLYKDELMLNWLSAQSSIPKLKKIEPLK